MPEGNKSQSKNTSNKKNPPKHDPKLKGMIRKSLDGEK